MNRRLVPLRRVEGAPAEIPDETLVASCATGESAALGALFDRHYDAVRRFISRMSGTDADLDDLVQVTFATVPRAARSFDGRASPRTWLLGIASNVVRHHVRAAIRRKRLAEEVAAEARKQTTVDATDEVLERERARRLQLAIVSLPPRLREAFVLVYLEGIPGREVAVLVGAREGTIWKRLHQARALLRKSLEEVD